MFEHKLDEKLDFTIIGHWFLLALNAGLINAGGFISCGRFVTHVTGFATLFGVDLATGHLDKALGILSIPLFFMLGAFISGLLVDGQIYQKQKPHPDLVMGLCSLLLLSAALFGHGHFFGTFGTEYTRHDYILLAMLCLASGLQNGAITSSSGSSVRTTHLTGTTTDLGLGLARLIYFVSQHKKSRESFFNLLRLGTISSFIIGSGLGAAIFFKVGYLGFLIPSAICAYVAWYARFHKSPAPHRLDPIV